MPVFTAKTVNDPSNLSHGRHPGFLLAIVEELIPDGWEMGKKDTHMFRWHLAIWEQPDHIMQYAPEEQSAISSRAFSPKGKFQASKAYVWSCTLLGRDIPKGQGVDLDPLLPLACWCDVERVPGNDYCKIAALWGRPEGQAQIPPVILQLKAQYRTGFSAESLPLTPPLVRPSSPPVPVTAGAAQPLQGVPAPQRPTQPPMPGPRPAEFSDIPF